MNSEELKNSDFDTSHSSKKRNIVHLLILLVVILLLVLAFSVLDLQVRVTKGRDGGMRKDYQKLPESLENKNVSPVISCPANRTSNLNLFTVPLLSKNTQQIAYFH